jgi:hypothetical protein
MRITDAEGKPLGAVYLALSNQEADELTQALEDLKSAKPGWHAHVSDPSYQQEVTVYREDDQTAADSPIVNPS